MNKLITALASALAFAGATHAASYDASSFTTTGPGFNFTASGALGFKTIDGWSGRGGEGGPSGSEIDLEQFLQINFDNPEIVDNLSLAFLYDGTEYGDPNEK